MPVNLESMLEESGAILKGHFLLTSGRHSNIYFEKFRVLEQPEVLTALTAELAERARELQVDLIVGPTTGGIIIAFDVARHLGISARYVESVNGVKQLRRNASIPDNSRVLIVDDVLTTGLSLQETKAVVDACGGTCVGYGVLIDRSESFEPELPLLSAYRVEAKSYDPDNVPDWLAQTPIQKPGTRK